MLNVTIYPNDVSIDHTLISIPFGNQSFGQWFGDQKLFQTTSWGHWPFPYMVRGVSDIGNSLCYCVIGKAKVLLFVHLR